MWHGPSHSSVGSAQAYYTSTDLAHRVVKIARKRAPRGAHFLDIGVGGGALYSLLPKPRSGIELRRLHPRLTGVEYGVDALKWAPPATWRERDVCVVCNPPFAKQIEIINACAAYECASLCVVWIAGLSVRHWDTEDRIDAHLHLEAEWLTPPELSTFATSKGGQEVRTVVQVWKWRPRARRLWRDLPLAPSRAPAFEASPKGTVFVTRLNSACLVGRAGKLGRDVRLERGEVRLTPRGQENIEDSRPIQCGASSAQKLGKVQTRGKEGTFCLRLQTANADGLVKAILQRRAQGAFYWLLLYRNPNADITSLSLKTLQRILSPSWQRLARPIKFLDGKTRSDRQW